MKKLAVLLGAILILIVLWIASTMTSTPTLATFAGLAIFAVVGMLLIFMGGEVNGADEMEAMYKHFVWPHEGRMHEMHWPDLDKVPEEAQPTQVGGVVVKFPYDTSAA